MRIPAGFREPVAADHFKSIPWCAAYLTSVTEPTIYWPTPWERGTPGSGDKFFASTLNTSLTIPHLLFFHRDPPPSSPPNELIPDLFAFLQLESGIGGFPGYAHGGFVCTILDEITGLLCSLNRARGAMDRRPAMTGYLNTRFLKPVKVPGTVLARARVTRTEGRKSWVEGWLEDESGEVLAKAEAIFVNLKGRL